MYHKRILRILLCFVVAAFVLAATAAPSHAQDDDKSEGVSTAQVQEILEDSGMKTKISHPSKGQDLLTVTWDHEHFHYEAFVSISQNKWVWFLSPLQGIPEPSEIPQDVLLELLHQNDQNGGWYFSWDPDQKRFYLNHLFFHAEFDKETVKSSVALYESILAKTLRYWDPKQWDNPTAPIPSIMPE